MTTQEKVIRWFYLKEIPTVVDSDGIHVSTGGLSFKLSPLQIEYIAKQYDILYGQKTNAQIIEDISDAIVYIEGCLDHWHYCDADLEAHRDTLRGLAQAMNLIKQL